VIITTALVETAAIMNATIRTFVSDHAAPRCFIRELRGIV